MTTLREAAQQALTVLDGMEQNYGNLWQVNASQEGLDALCAALRAALAEPEPRNQCAETCERAKLCATCARGIDWEAVAADQALTIAMLKVELQTGQEPVAWMCSNTELMHKGYQRFAATRGGDWNIPVYTTPQPAKQPLTDEGIHTIEEAIWNLRWMDDDERKANMQFARAIERAHGITGETK